MYMAGASENIKFSEIADNEIAASENIYFTPILTVTPEKSTTVNAIWNEETPNQVDFDGVGDYLTIEDQTIEHISYDNTGTVYFTNQGSHNTVGPGNVLSVVSNWSGYAVGHNAIEYSEDSYVGVEWNTVRMTSGHQYSMVGFRTADDGRSLNTTDAYKNMSYSVYTVDRSSSNETNIFDVRNQWQPGSNRSSTTGNNNTLQNIYVTDSFDPSAKIKMVVNPSTKKVEVWHAGVIIYTFSFPLTAASYPINVWTNVYKGKVENIKIINEKQQFNNYISDKCWTFNCWIRIPATQETTNAYILDINDGTGGKVYLVGLKNNTQLYACEGGTTNKEYFGTNISADEWHMLTISQKPQETTTIYNPPYEYHSSNSIYGNNSIGVTTNPYYHGLGKLDSPQAWVLPGSDLTNTAHNGGTGSVNYSRWYQLQLPNVQKVFGAITQGRYSTATTYQYVTKWKFKYSKDNIIWIDVDGGAEFVGNTDANTKVYQTFANPVLARYIRFYPQTYYNWSSARMGLSVAPLPGHISVYLDGQKDTGASQGVNDNYISIPSSAKWSIGSGFSVATGTQITGSYITGGSKPVTHVLNLGNNIWIVGVIDGPHLKMIKIEITGENTYNYVATRYTTGTATTSACSNPSTFSEACFIGTESSNGTYVVNLVTGEGFKGSAKEIMIWGKGLSDYEIAALHKLGHKNVGQTDIIEEDAVFTSSAGHNTINGNSVSNTGANTWEGWATTDEDSSIVGIKYQLIDTTANVFVGLLTGGEMISSAVAYRWKGWKTYRPPHTSMLQTRYAPDGYNMTPVSEDSYTTNIQTVTTQTVKFIINEDTNYPEIYIDDNLVHTFTNRTINISDYPFACAVNCAVGGVKNVKVLKRTISQRYLHNEEPFNPVFDPPYTHHSSPWIIYGEDPGENSEEGRGRLSDNGAWAVVQDTTVGPTSCWVTTTHVNSNNETYYYQIDYSADGNDKIPIAGVVTYGRYGLNQWVTKWKFKYFNGSTWEWVDDGYEFDGNTHNDQRNSVYFDGPVDTTGIRFFPTGYSSYPSARMALLLYKPNAPLYAIVDGHGGISNVNHVGWGISQVISAQLGYWGTSYGSQPTCMRITTDSHSLDFSMHPGYSNGLARVEYANNGASILGNQSMGWTPAGSQYHTYFVTMRLNGTHTFGITDADGVRTWSKDFSLSNWSSLNIEVALSCEGSFVTASIPVGGSAEFTRNGQHQLQSLLINLNRYNNTWLFNGNNYLRLEGLLATTTYNNRSFVGKTNISFSCWFYKINQGTNLDVIYSCHDGTTNRYIHKVNLDGSLWFYSNPGGEQWITRPGFIQTQKWYHYAFTRNGGTFTFYINGKKVSDDDIVTHKDSTTKNPLINQVSHSYTTNYRFSIGQEWDGGAPSDHWKGKISNIYFWDRTLTGDEIYSVYHNFGVSKSEFAGKLLMDNTIIPEASDNANISISSYFKDKQFLQSLTPSLVEILQSLASTLNNLNNNDIQSKINGAGFTIFAKIKTSLFAEQLGGKAVSSFPYTFTDNEFKFIYNTANTLGSGENLVKQKIASDIQEARHFMAMAIYANSSDGVNGNFEGILLWTFTGSDSGGKKKDGTDKTITNIASLFINNGFNSNNDFWSVYPYFISITGNIETGTESGWRFSNNQQAGATTGYYTTSKFASDDGAWAIQFGSNIDGNSPGPYLLTDSSSYGIINPNSSDANFQCRIAGSQKTDFKAYVFYSSV